MATEQPVGRPASYHSWRAKPCGGPKEPLSVHAKLVFKQAWGWLEMSSASWRSTWATEQRTLISEQIRQIERLEEALREEGEFKGQPSTHP